MRFHDLRVFLNLVNTKNFTQTAENFYISQPSVSKSINKLEKKLDTILFIRKKGSHSLILSETGKVFKRHAEDILNTLNHSFTEIDKIDNQRANLGVPQILGGYFLPIIMPNLYEYYDYLEIIESDGSLSMLEKLKNRDVETAIIGLNEEITDKLPNLSTQLLRIEKFNLFISKNHKFVDKEELTIEDLKDEVFISFGDGYVQNKVFKNWLKDNKLEENKVIYTDKLQTAKAFVRAGVGTLMMINLGVNDTENMKRISLKNAPKFYVYLIMSDSVSESSLQYKLNQSLIESMAAHYQ